LLVCKGYFPEFPKICPKNFYDLDGLFELLDQTDFLRLPESSVQASVVIFGAANVFQGAAVDFGCAFKLVVTRQTCTNPVNIC